MSRAMGFDNYDEGADGPALAAENHKMQTLLRRLYFDVCAATCTTMFSDPSPETCEAIIRRALVEAKVLT